MSKRSQDTNIQTTWLNWSLLFHLRVRPSYSLQLQMHRPCWSKLIAVVMLMYFLKAKQGFYFLHSLGMRKRNIYVRPCHCNAPKRDQWDISPPVDLPAYMSLCICSTEKSHHRLKRYLTPSHILAPFPQKCAFRQAAYGKREKLGMQDGYDSWEKAKLLRLGEAI